MKCISTYEDVKVGDTGPVMKIENEGLHDLNVRVSSDKYTLLNHINIYIIDL